MSTLQNQLTLSHVYNHVKAILDSADGSTDKYLEGLSLVELFCQQHEDHYYVLNRCNIDLNQLHQIALSGLCSCLKDTILDRLKECVSILYEYKVTTEEV